jgi:hypothetical protein
LYLEIRKNHQRDRDGETKQPNTEKEAEKPAEHDNRTALGQLRLYRLSELKVHGCGIIPLFPFHSLQIQDHLDDGEDDHGDADSQRVESGLESPVLGLINEDDKKDKKNKAKNSLRSDLQMEIPPQFAQP